MKKKQNIFYLCDVAGKQTSIEATDDGLIAMKNWKRVENLKNIKNETLIIWGNKDKAYNFDQIKTLNDDISINDLKIIEGCSHNVYLEKPDEFKVIVGEFLKKNDWYWLKYLAN